MLTVLRSRQVQRRKLSIDSLVSWLGAFTYRIIAIVSQSSLLRGIEPSCRDPGLFDTGPEPPESGCQIWSITVLQSSH